jgi:hypothetical protein
MSYIQYHSKNVPVDLIGRPWIIQVCNKPYEFNALTVIDTVSNLVELVRIDEKTLAHVARKYTQVWLSRYPWPKCCVHDNDGEFVGPEFQFLLQGCRIKDAPTSSKNPQANAICEWMHQTVENSTNSSTRWISTRRHQSKKLHRWSAINCYTCYAYKHPFYLRK